MAIWHLRSERKATGGATQKSRKKKSRERGSSFLETRIGKKKIKMDRRRGNNQKIRLMVIDRANVYNPQTKKMQMAAIKTVKDNPANPHYIRRNIITKGAVIETDIGLARVTSRPGQHGVVNAVLVGEKK